MVINASPTTQNPIVSQTLTRLDPLDQWLQVSQATPRAIALDWLQALQRRAVTQLSELALPTKKDEDWRFTDLSSLQAMSFGVPDTQIGLDPLAIAPLILPEVGQQRLVFVNGRYAPELSALEDLPREARVGNLATIGMAHPELQTHLAQQTDAAEVFTTLNTTGFRDAAVIWLPKGLVLTAPLHLLFITVGSGQATLVQPRCLLIGELASRITLVEDYVTLGPGCFYGAVNGTYFTNGVTEIRLRENAQVHHIRLQRESGSAFHVGQTLVSQGRGSRYTSYAITLGANLSRHNLRVQQRETQAETTLNGLVLLGGDQVADTHSSILHTQPHGTSCQLHKCIVGDRAHAIFNGRIIVPQAAQMTNASQLNRNLLLSPKARVDTKPQLEIVADNVKCAHGATVSQLEVDETFYLQSRGLDRDSARNLLIDAFAGEIFQQLPLPSLQTSLSRCLACRNVVDSAHP